MIERVTRMHLTKEGEAIFNERSYAVEIDDQAAGEYVVVSGHGDEDGRIAIDPDDWPALKAVIDKMVKECR